MLHARQRIVDAGGDWRIHKYCSHHKSIHLIAAFSTSPKMHDGRHNICKDATNKYRRSIRHRMKKFDWKDRLTQQYRRVFNKYTNREICKL